MTEDYFLEPIRRYLADDQPRLAYADWLEENGHAAQAEFIRVQCDLAETDLGHHDELCGPNIGCVHWCPVLIRETQKADLARREEFLLNDNWRDWLEGLQHVLRADTNLFTAGFSGSVLRVAVTFRRGFITTVDGNMADLIGVEDGSGFMPRPGLLPVVMAHRMSAVERVRVTDKSPLYLQEEEGSFSWFIDRERDPNLMNCDDPAHRIPRRVFDGLRFGRRSERPSGGAQRTYSTVDIALADLEAAVLGIARRKAEVF